MRKETSERSRERLIREEHRNNTGGNFNDSVNRSSAGIPNMTGMSTKEMGVLIIVGVLVFVGYSVYKLF